MLKCPLASAFTGRVSKGPPVTVTRPFGTVVPVTVCLVPLNGLLTGFTVGDDIAKPVFEKIRMLISPNMIESSDFFMAKSVIFISFSSLSLLYTRMLIYFTVRFFIPLTFGIVSPRMKGKSKQ